MVVRTEQGSVEKEQRSTVEFGPNGALIYGFGGVEVTYEKSGIPIKSYKRDLEKPKPLPANGPYATIGVRREFTKNLGNYQSIKGGVWLELPSGTSAKEITDSYNEAATFIAHSAAEELKDALEWSQEVGL